ncbi:MAG: hypothetical protein LBG79_05995 [Spirochaetaceae bacterium]|jgi:hypothetical protein|nr:hypothetical protein [Spirochaetaceae bacterium]GMO17937.1 MAG: hypothetical protein Pg6A_04610 [Termitinemataceae bacterium]
MKVNDPEKKRHFDEKTRKYEEKIRAYLKNEVTVLEECQNDPDNAALKLWALSNDMLNLASNYLAINGVCRMVFEQRDETALGEARKAVSKAIVYIENIVTGKIDVPFSDYEENLAELSSISPAAKYDFTRKIGCCVALLKLGYGDNTKWHWSFVDIEGRYTAVAKNLLDLRKAFGNNDPSAPDYEPLLYHLNLVKSLVEQQAHKFQERYSIATKRPDDIRLAMNFLSTLRQFHLMLNDTGEAEETKKKYDSWKQAYENEKRKSRETKKIAAG